MNPAAAGRCAREDSTSDSSSPCGAVERVRGPRDGLDGAASPMAAMTRAGSTHCEARKPRQPNGKETCRQANRRRSHPAPWISMPFMSGTHSAGRP